MGGEEVQKGKGLVKIWGEREGGRGDVNVEVEVLLEEEEAGWWVWDVDVDLVEEEEEEWQDIEGRDEPWEGCNEGFRDNSSKESEEPAVNTPEAGVIDMLEKLVGEQSWWLPVTFVKKLALGDIDWGLG